MSPEELSVMCNIDNGSCRSSSLGTATNGLPTFLPGLTAEQITVLVQAERGDWADPDIDAERYLRVSQGKEE